jgi:hypothetical protein
VFDFSTNRSPVTYQCFLDSGPATTCSPPVTYAGLANGSHTFSLIATYTDPSTGLPTKTKAARTWTVSAPPHGPDTTLTSRPAAQTTATIATFSFDSSSPSATFECSLDDSPFTTCTSPLTYRDLGLGRHSFEVRAVSDGVVDSSPATADWAIRTVPPSSLDTLLTNRPPATTASTRANFGFVSEPAGASFECALDGAPFSACTSPTTYPGLSQGNHRFRVRALEGDLRDPSPAAAGWTIQVVAPPLDTRLTERPGASTRSTTATFSFVSEPAGARFECAVDNAPFAACTSPVTYSSLDQGTHRFRVRAVVGARRDETPAAAGWTVEAATAGGGSSPWPVLGGLALIAALAGGALSWRHVRLVRRRGIWQLEASDEELPPTCKVPQQYTWRRKCTATPSLWTVEAVAVSDPNRAETAQRYEIESAAVVAGLNEALSAHRTRAEEGRVREILQPVAEQLGTEVDAWLERWKEASIGELTATLSGCEFECEFTHYQCVPNGAANHWQKRDSWKAKVKSKASVPLAALTRPPGSARPGGVDRAKLRAEVLSFVGRVDIPWKMRERQLPTEDSHDEWAEGLGRLPQN